jgi:hypothetical protein
MRSIAIGARALRYVFCSAIKAMTPEASHMLQPAAPVAPGEEPSLSELLNTALSDARLLLRAELALGKAELKQTLKLAAATLIVVTASGLLLALGLSLGCAALLLALHATVVEALLGAALVNILIAGIAVIWLRSLLRGPAPESDGAASDATNPIGDA